MYYQYSGYETHRTPVAILHKTQINNPICVSCELTER